MVLSVSHILASALALTWRLMLACLRAAKWPFGVLVLVIAGGFVALATDTLEAAYPALTVLLLIPTIKLAVMLHRACLLESSKVADGALWGRREWLYGLCLVVLLLVTSTVFYLGLVVFGPLLAVSFMVAANAFNPLVLLLPLAMAVAAVLIASLIGPLLLQLPAVALDKPLPLGELMTLGRGQRLKLGLVVAGLPLLSGLVSPPTVLSHGALWLYALGSALSLYGMLATLVAISLVYEQWLPMTTRDTPVLDRRGEAVGASAWAWLAIYALLMALIGGFIWHLDQRSTRDHDPASAELRPAADGSFTLKRDVQLYTRDRSEFSLTYQLQWAVRDAQKYNRGFDGQPRRASARLADYCESILRQFVAGLSAPEVAALAAERLPPRLLNDLKDRFEVLGLAATQWQIIEAAPGAR